MEVSELLVGVEESGADKVGEYAELIGIGIFVYEDGARPVYELWTTAGDLRYGHDDASPHL
jgi:hypothetical protein